VIKVNASNNKRPARGFTLLEMLVTLVLVSLVGLIISQALLQVARIERLLAGGSLRAMVVALHGEWVRDALAGLLPGEKGSAERFAGDARALQGLSTAVPQWPAPGLAPMRLSLEFNERAGRTELLLHSDGLRRDVLSAAQPAPQLLLSWPGNSGRWRYLDAVGAWHERWPPQLSGAVAPAALPAGVALESGDPALGTLLAAPVAGDAQPPTRRAMERL
jgi:prepilin-type N-terminal cleavage/methylation domain-containing protein